MFPRDELIDMGRTCVNVIGNCLRRSWCRRAGKKNSTRIARAFFGTPQEAELDFEIGDVAFSPMR